MTEVGLRAWARSVPGVARLRAYAEHAVAPNLRADVHRLRQDVEHLAVRESELQHHIDRLGDILRRVEEGLDTSKRDLERIRAEHDALDARSGALSERVDLVLESVVSTNKVARLARREMDALRELVESRQPVRPDE